MKLFGSKRKKPKIQSLLIEEKDILGNLSGDKGTSLFLGKYALKEVKAVLEKRNFLNDARKRNLWPLDFLMDSSEFPLQKFQIFYSKKKPENLIVDLKIREGLFRPKERTTDFPFEKYRFLILDWFTLQNPLKKSPEHSLLLPGQKYPGLSLGKKVVDVFVYLARLFKLDGVLAFPAYFHNAILFSRCFTFINPEKQGEIHAIRKSFRDVYFKQLAWIVHLNCLKEKGNKIYEWKAEEQLYPLNKILKNYFDSKEYKEKVDSSMKQNLKKYFIDWDCYRKKIKEGVKE